MFNKSPRDICMIILDFRMYINTYYFKKCFFVYYSIDNNITARMSFVGYTCSVGDEEFNSIVLKGERSKKLNSLLSDI